MTLNDLECPIHLKVRFTDGTIDVRTLWCSDSGIRIGVARGSGGEGDGGSNPTLPPCGQLTRCFSAVAELLVMFNNDAVRNCLFVHSRLFHKFIARSEKKCLFETYTHVLYAHCI